MRVPGRLPEAPAGQVRSGGFGPAFGGVVQSLREVGWPPVPLLAPLADLHCQVPPIVLPRLDLGLRVSPADAERMAERGRRAVHAFALGIGVPPRIDLSRMVAAVRGPIPCLRVCLPPRATSGPPAPVARSPGRGGEYDYQQRLRNRRRRAKKGRKRT